MYSNTSATPSPVFADVKNSFGPLSGGNGATKAGAGANSKGGDGLVAVPLALALAFSRANRLGVMVTALPELALPVESIVAVRRLTLAGGLSGGARLSSWSMDLDHGSGEDRAD